MVLFAYARPDHLRRTLECLKANRVPRIYAYSDGPAAPDKEAAVAEVRRMLRAIDWAEVMITERETNMGLGRSILSGVTEVLATNDAAIVFEDDLICVPGTYEYLSAALDHYRDDSTVMSVTGWTHPLVTPSDVSDQPYFDGRAECWVWGTWARAWKGMDVDAKTLMDQCAAKGIDVYKYGADLVEMAESELARNIWAVRLLYLHILKGGLCMRPPWSMVEHIGFDIGTNVGHAAWLEDSVVRAAPAIPDAWPLGVENTKCAPLHRAMNPPYSPPARSFSARARGVLSRARRAMVARSGETEQTDGLYGDFNSWASATDVSAGYNANVILRKTEAALLQVRDGKAKYERDSVLFDEVQYAWPLLSGLLWVAAQSGGRLDVLDIGGSLGSTYFQNRVFLGSLDSLRWNVVEQQSHVAAGKKSFENEALRFFETIEECLASAKPNVVILSSVLQYLEKPHAMLNSIARIPVDHAIVDRTSFWRGNVDKLCVQQVPPTIYPASYPIWVFSESRFRDALASTWTTVAEFESLDALPNSLGAVWRGMILERRSKSVD